MRPPRGGIGGERRPLNIGERDLYPQGLGPHDPLRGGGFGPGGGGMHPTFDDPMFGGRRGGGGQYVVPSTLSLSLFLSYFISFPYVSRERLNRGTFFSTYVTRFADIHISFLPFLQGPARREIRSHRSRRRTSTGARRLAFPRWRRSAAESIRGLWRQ